MKRALSKASPVLKVLFGAGIFAWMAASGKLNLAQIAKGLTHWPLMLGVLGLGCCQIGIMVWRWTLLLHAQDITLPFRRAWGLTMIGLLFNVAIPGSVGGDLIKGYYITRATDGRKTHAATSIMMDRVVGLIGLLFLSAAVVLANVTEILRIPAMRALGGLAVASFAVGVVGLFAALFAGGRLSEWSFLPRILRDVFSALHEYRRKSDVVRNSLALSVLNQALTCFAFYLALRATGVTDLRMSQFFLIVPLGLVTCAVPISPAGIGVGQAAFYTLFQIVAPAYASAGTDAFTIFQAMSILLGLSGLFWYVAYKHRALALGTPTPAPQPRQRWDDGTRKNSGAADR
jgi:uncharacterized protein (TIRG00374 family)